MTYFFEWKNIIYDIKDDPVLQVSRQEPSMSSNSPPYCPHPSWCTSNWDIKTKLSGYLPWGKIRSFMTSRMTISSKYPVRNPQCPTSTPMKDPPLLDTLIIKISTRNFQGIFLGVKQGRGEKNKNLIIKDSRRFRRIKRIYIYFVNVNYSAQYKTYCT